MKETALFATRLAIMIAALTMAACGGIQVRTDHRPETDFSAPKTYSWNADPKLLSLYPLIRSEELDGYIRGLVDRELATKGYRKADNEKADFVLRYWASVERKTGSTEVRERPSYLGSDGLYFSVSTVREYNFDVKEGSLLIDMLRPGTDVVAWRGVVEAAVKADEPKEARRKKIDDAVRKMFHDFPPR